MKSLPHVLVIAGSDSSGGAGIARDIATLSRLGARASLAITAVTAQTHAEVSAVEVQPASLVAAQMRAALAAEPVAAIKIGMLANAGIVEAVAEVLVGHETVPVVLDPVIASSSGTRLLSDAGIASLLARLLPFAALITPNLPELAILAGRGVARSDADAARQAFRLLDAGARSVLVKGGHASGEEAIDTLYHAQEPPRRFSSRRRPQALRGTGCIMSSAIAAHLALGHDVGAAVSTAKAYIDERFDAEGSLIPNRDTKAATV
jgi:hydroxymethylpyrimidine/phosphomethylpyrimidine kinase